jgi:molybdopterin-dependent oxidoreductase alpha subunit
VSAGAPGPAPGAPDPGRDGQPPISSEQPTVAPAPSAAAGLKSVTAAGRMGIRQMGVARALRTLSQVNQFEGFDCPSCAWPEPDDRRAMAEFCENGAKAVASEATRARAGPEFFAEHSIADLTAQSDRWLNDAGRLTHPLVLREGDTHYEPISWEGAFAMIAGELRALPSPDAATFYTSGRTGNEAAFLYQLFVRQFGTNNLPDCSNMCHESSGYALLRSIGIGKGTVTLEDFDKADSIWVIGQNPGTNHPRMLSSLERAARNGCTIVSVNPLREVGLVRFKQPQALRGLVGRGTPLASLFVRVRINGDLAFLKGVMKEMLEADEHGGRRVLAHGFIRERTEGFEALAADLRAESWGTICAESGLDRRTIGEAAAVAGRSGRMIVCWAMGITQHESAVATIQTIANFALLRGQIGRPGAGLCPVRGHSNVQGDRTMGICERMPVAFMERLGAEFGFEPPRRPGLDVVDSIRAMHDGRVRVFIAMGGNFLSAAPDTAYTAEALRNCSLTVQVSTKLNRGHLVTGRRALILPCLGRTERDRRATGEQFVTVEDSMGKVHASRGVLEPASEHLLSEPAIVCRLARAVLGSSSRVPWDRFEGDYDLVRDGISRVVSGFEDFNRRVRARAGFYLANGPREGVFPTGTGKAKFFVHPIPHRPLGPGQLLLMTIRTHDQFNTTVYGEDDRYRGIFGTRRVVFANRQDIAQRALRDRQLVDITSHHNGRERAAERFTLIEYDIPRGCAAAYFPETNVLVPADSVAKGSNQPASKSVVITLRPSQAAK